MPPNSTSMSMSIAPHCASSMESRNARVMSASTATPPAVSPSLAFRAALRFAFFSLNAFTASADGSFIRRSGTPAFLALWARDRSMPSFFSLLVKRESGHSPV